MSGIFEDPPDLLPRELDLGYDPEVAGTGADSREPLSYDPLEDSPEHWNDSQWAALGVQRTPRENLTGPLLLKSGLAYKLSYTRDEDPRVAATLLRRHFETRARVDADPDFGSVTFKEAKAMLQWAEGRLQAAELRRDGITPPAMQQVPQDRMESLLGRMFAAPPEKRAADVGDVGRAGQIAALVSAALQLSRGIPLEQVVGTLTAPLGFAQQRLDLEQASAAERATADRQKAAAQLELERGQVRDKNEQAVNEWKVKTATAGQDVQNAFTGLRDAWERLDKLTAGRKQLGRGVQGLLLGANSESSLEYALDEAAKIGITVTPQFVTKRRAEIAEKGKLQGLAIDREKRLTADTYNTKLNRAANRYGGLGEEEAAALKAEYDDLVKQGIPTTLLELPRSGATLRRETFDQRVKEFNARYTKLTAVQKEQLALARSNYDLAEKRYELSLREADPEVIAEAARARATAQKEVSAAYETVDKDLTARRDKAESKFVEARNYWLERKKDLQRLKADRDSTREQIEQAENAVKLANNTQLRRKKEFGVIEGELAKVKEDRPGPAGDDGLGKAVDDAVGSYRRGSVSRGGTCAPGEDCSSGVQGIMKNLGVKLPRTTSEQHKVGTTVASGWSADLPARLRPGDLVFFNTVKGDKDGIGHVGIYRGNGVFTHNSGSVRSKRPYRFVADAKLVDWASRFVKAQRILDGGR